MPTSRFHYAVRSRFLSLTVLGATLAGAACAARPLPTPLELPVGTVTPVPMPTIAVADAAAPPAQTALPARTCTIHGSGWPEGGWGGDLEVRVGTPTAAPRVRLVTPQVQGVTWTDLPTPDLDRVATVDIALFGALVHGWAPIRDRDMRLGVRAWSDDGVVWGQPGRRAVLRGARGSDAYLELTTGLPDPKALLVHLPCAELTSDERAKIDPESLPSGATMTPAGAALHLRARAGGPVVRRLQVSVPLAIVEQDGSFDRVFGVTDVIGFDGWVRHDELTSRGIGMAGYGSGHGRLGTRCAGGTERRLAHDGRLLVGAAGTAFAVAGTLEENATVVERSRAGSYVEIVLPPCALVPAVAGESFWVRADDLQ